jgi:integrase/recombinase XerD
VGLRVRTLNVTTLHGLWRIVEGAYYLEWRENGKRVHLSVGKETADAGARRQRKEAELNANKGVAVVPNNGNNGHRSLAAAVAEFLDETKLTKKRRSRRRWPRTRQL